MAETVGPVAVRVTRPYASEDELLENELDTFTRTSITLLGAQPRPPGLVLRFELLLSSGQALVRGEGRVVGYRRDAYYGLGGLTLRFTRLDSKSKAFVDKAAATRERRRPSSKAPPVEAPSSPSLPPLEIPSSPSLPAIEAPSSPALSIRLEEALEVPVPPAPPSVAPPAPSLVSPVAPVAPAAMFTRTALSAAMTPHDRDSLLARLRERSKALSEDAVRKLLERSR